MERIHLCDHDNDNVNLHIFQQAFELNFYYPPTAFVHYRVDARYILAFFNIALENLQILANPWFNLQMLTNPWLLMPLSNLANASQEDKLQKIS